MDECFHSLLCNKTVDILCKTAAVICSYQRRSLEDLLQHVLLDFLHVSLHIVPGVPKATQQF